MLMTMMIMIMTCWSCHWCYRAFSVKARGYYSIGDSDDNDDDYDVDAVDIDVDADDHDHENHDLLGLSLVSLFFYCKEDITV